MSEFLGETHEDKLAFFDKLSKDPWFFLQYVLTQDEVDRATPIKQFPIHLEYLKYFTRIFQAKDLIAIPKSRRMKMSWTCISLFLHEAIWGIGSHQAFVSKKEEDADALVRRAKFILDHLDQRVPKEFIPRYEYKYCELKFPEIDSKIEAFPSGADQLRQYTFSRILGDEMAFWPDAQEMYKGAKPTLEGGGKMVLISSATPSFFEKIVFDQLDQEEDVAIIDTSRKILRPMQGLEIWENKKNKFTVFQTHYTADPAKRSEEWKERNKSGMPIRDWNMEYEITWESWAGLPIFPDWNSRKHLSKTKIAPVPGLPLLRGWDFGLTPACIVCQYVEDKLHVIKEYTEFNMGALRFSEKVIKNCRIDFPRWSDQKKHWKDFIDPSGEYRKDTDEGTCAMILQGHGLDTIPGAIAWGERKKSVEDWLMKYGPEGALLQVSEEGCTMFVKGMNGGYQYPKDADVIEPNKLRPLKNKYSHIADAFQMITSMLSSLRHSSGLRVPTPRYSARP